MQPEVCKSKLALSWNAVPVTAFIVLLAGLGLSCSNIASSGPDSTIHGETNQASFTVPREFMGFSLEWGEAKPMMGTPATGTNPIFRQLIRNLVQDGGGPIVIRIGGNSTDSVETNGEPSPAEISAYGQLHHDTGAQFYLSVNLASNDVGLPARQAQYFLKNMPAGSIESIELGNEPDLYAQNGTRKPSYKFGDYLAEFNSRESGLRSALPAGLKVMGPSWSGLGNLKYLPQFLAAESPRLNIVSQHWYVDGACGGKNFPPKFLLNATTSSAGAQAVASSVALAHSEGLLFRIGEMNSIACDGEVGVTDTFASALWMIDSLFELASVGVDGVNVHMDVDDAYGPFLFDLDTDTKPYTYSIKVIRPEYYGMYFFQKAAPGGSKLVRTNNTNVSGLKSWMTIDDLQTVRITIINKDEKASRKVPIRVPGHGAGLLERLVAPSYSARTGISIGGLSFDGSKDGRLVGVRKYETVSPADGVYEIELAPTSAALLTIKPQL